MCSGQLGRCHVGSSWLSVLYTECTPTACTTYNTVCSQARTDTECVPVAQELETAQSHCIIFVRLKESVIRSAVSHPCWSLPHLLTCHVPQHAAQPGQRDLLREDTVHPERLPQEPLPKTSANAIRSKSNTEESLSHPNSHASCALLSFSFGLCSCLTFLSPVSSVASSCPSCSCSLSSSVSKPGGCSLGLCSPS